MQKYANIWVNHSAFPRQKRGSRSLSAHLVEGADGNGKWEKRQTYTSLVLYLIDCGQGGTKERQGAKDANSTEKGPPHIEELNHLAARR